MSTVVRIQLGENDFETSLDRMHRDTEGLSDVAIVFAFRHQP